MHYWDGAAPDGRGIRDISETGAYILTAERWYQGTIIRIILQGHPAVARGRLAGRLRTSICVPAQVVRQGDDGVALEFVFPEQAGTGKTPRIPGSSFPAIRHRSRASGTSTARRKGQALVEFALIMPLVFLLAVNAANFGGFIFGWITVAGAARDAAQYMVMSSASPGSPTPATTAQITALVTNDVTVTPEPIECRGGHVYQQNDIGEQLHHACRPRSAGLYARDGRCNLHLPAIHPAVLVSETGYQRHAAVRHYPPKGSHEDAAVTGIATDNSGGGRSGQTLVEFSLVAFLTGITLLFVVEMGRMLLVYAAIANAAREGVRYAIVHGSSRTTGSAQNNASGPSSNPAQVVTVVDNFAGVAPLTTSRLVISVTYPGASNAPGQAVNVSVVYPYDPFVTYFPSTLRLGSSSRGIILF